MDFLQQLFELCIVPLLGLITAYLVKFIKQKNLEITSQLDSELAQKYADSLTQIIEDCVVSTNQTYVDSLKGKQAFTKEAQKEAFEQTYEKVMDILTDEAKQQLAAMYGDLNVYITTKIEAEVNFNKLEDKANGQKETKI